MEPIDYIKLGFMAGYDFGVDDAPDHNPKEAWNRYTKTNRITETGWIINDKFEAQPRKQQE